MTLLGSLKPLLLPAILCLLYLFLDNVMDNQKIYKTLEIIVKAVLAIAALWLCISCTMSMSISKNNMNSTQSTEQSQATSVDSTNVDVDYK